MNTIRKNKMNKVVVFLLLLACLVSTTGFAVKAAGNVSVWLPVIQTVEVPDSTISEDEQSFEYTLTPLETGNPMPEGSSENKYIMTLTGDEEAQIQIDYSRTGVYSYHFTQKSEENSGFTCENKQYTITVYVKHGGDGELVSEASVAKQSNGMKDSALKFTNVYDPELFEEQKEVPSNDAGTASEEPAAQQPSARNTVGNNAATLSADAGDASDAGEDLEKLDSEAVPRGLRNTDAWALWNLILAAATLLGGIILFAAYLLKKKHSQENSEQESEQESEEVLLHRPLRIASLILGTASLIFFFLTENVTLPVKLTDQYTWIMVVGFVIQLIFMIYIVAKGNEKTEEAQS